MWEAPRARPSASALAPMRWSVALIIRLHFSRSDLIAPTAALGPGALAGNYVGGTASATVGVGLGANALVGGSNNSIALQPLSIEANRGLNVAGGIAAVTLTPPP